MRTDGNSNVVWEDGTHQKLLHVMSEEKNLAGVQLKAEMEPVTPIWSGISMSHARLLREGIWNSF